MSDPPTGDAHKQNQAGRSQREMHRCKYAATPTQIVRHTATPTTQQKGGQRVSYWRHVERFRH